MSQETIASRHRGTHSQRATDGVLILYSVPIFAFWVSSFVAIVQVRLHRAAVVPIILWYALLLGSPVSVGFGWVRFIRHRKRHHRHDLRFGRNILIAGSILAAPVVVYTLVLLVLLLEMYMRVH